MRAKQPIEISFQGGVLRLTDYKVTVSLVPDEQNTLPTLNEPRLTVEIVALGPWQIVSQ